MSSDDPAKNIALYPWYQFCRNLVFWQAIWFLFFQNRLSAAEAILLYAIYDIGTTALEVPSGYLSDRIGRRFTLIASAIAGVLGVLLLSFGGGFAAFALAQVFLGASTAFNSGTDSAVLFESLNAQDRQDEVEAQELKAWRFGFAALALSAVLGGAMSYYSEVLPFLTSALASGAVLVICLKFSEPPHRAGTIPQGSELLRLASLRPALTQPVLAWLFLLSVLMYGFSHLPFVFGQPFILEALADVGLAAEAPVVSGATSAVMMLLSVATSLIALRLRHAIGLPAILMLAFAMQIVLVAVLALTNSLFAIVLLFFRMVPNSLSQPFILARTQPLLADDSRATYLSLRSFCARLLFAGSLYLASLSTTTSGQMVYAELQQVLGWYVTIGVVALAALVVWARRIRIEPPPTVSA
ncbi:MFS transporter [Roseovarius aestuarii]|uniref:Major Facilitator Superfamily protein n=1 Tax=Roseovarius aestuarii TaxID=475083 RepID=A0A1X7BTF6_9RHOB|nr:MFS transporter [Roseovarius aestuarii]SMC12875.1 Major Facilitator Superfamily protein [Roseovarius aestuarii]